MTRAVASHWHWAPTTHTIMISDAHWAMVRVRFEDEGQVRILTQDEIQARCGSVYAIVHRPPTMDAVAFQPVVVVKCPPMSAALARAARGRLATSARSDARLHAPAHSPHHTLPD